MKSIVNCEWISLFVLLSPYSFVVIFYDRAPEISHKNRILVHRQFLHRRYNQPNIFLNVNNFHNLRGKLNNNARQSRISGHLIPDYKTRFLFKSNRAANLSARAGIFFGCINILCNKVIIEKRVVGTL